MSLFRFRNSEENSEPLTRNDSVDVMDLVNVTVKVKEKGKGKVQVIVNNVKDTVK